MNITVSIHEILSWLLTVTVVTLYLIERRKNSATPFFMALQGIRRACREKSGHLAVLAKSIARAGAKVFVDDKQVGYVTSGTSVPSWSSCGEGLDSKLTEEVIMRPVCLALIDSHLREEDKVQIEIRGRRVDAAVVAGHLRVE